VEPRVYFYLALAVAGYLAFLSPILLSAYLVTRRGSGVPGRWLFLIVGPILGYTLFWSAAMLVALPMSFIANFLVPAIVQILDVRPHWLPVVDWVAKYWYFVMPVFFATVVPAVTVWVWRRWPAVFAALVNRSSVSPATTDHGELQAEEGKNES
jgi:hypothetical protein